MAYLAEEVEPEREVEMDPSNSEVDQLGCPDL